MLKVGTVLFCGQYTEFCLIHCFFFWTNPFYFFSLISVGGARWRTRDCITIMLRDGGECLSRRSDFPFEISVPFVWGSSGDLLLEPSKALTFEYFLNKIYIISIQAYVLLSPDERCTGWGSYDIQNALGTDMQGTMLYNPATVPIIHQSTWVHQSGQRVYVLEIVYNSPYRCTLRPQSTLTQSLVISSAL